MFIFLYPYYKIWVSIRRLTADLGMAKKEIEQGTHVEMSIHIIQITYSYIVYNTVHMCNLGGMGVQEYLEM